MSLDFFSSQLNSSQLQAVTYCDGPSLVIAGAGSGKTRVLTYKIAYLLENGYKPWELLVLTFTNKAAREMNQRIESICNGIDLRGLWSGTFHSIFARMLRIEHNAIDYPTDYTIYDDSDSRSLLKVIIKEMQLDEKVYKPATIASRISEAKNHLILHDSYNSDTSIAKRDKADGIGLIGKIYTTYQQRLRAASAMDFDDLLVNTYILLRDNSEIRERYKQRFRYILVDEYQDTNIVQHKILRQLTNSDSHICVVGDDAQSIYGFRGADVRNILQFQDQYSSVQLIKLECNYRSTQSIVEAANSIISHNRSQIPKKIFSAGSKGDLIQVFAAQTDKEEAKKVVMRVSKLHKRYVPYTEIAILYRTNAQSRALEEAFQNAIIPYHIYGGLSFYQRKEIKDVLAYLRIVSNPNDEEAFRRIINYPARGIGNTTQQKIYSAALENGVSPWQVINNLTTYGVSLSSATEKKINAFCELIHSFQNIAASHNAYDVAVNIVRQSGIVADIMSDFDTDAVERRENVDELLGSIRSYEQEILEEFGKKDVTLPDFLSTVSLLTDADQRSDGSPRVTLMTVHAAKGLEFEAVFVTGMEEELFPNANARLYPKEMEEERRLFYVAVTRAKKYCFLSYARSRYRYGNFQFCEPSSFIDEIDEHYLDRTDKASSTTYSKPYGSQQWNTWQRDNEHRFGNKDFFQQSYRPRHIEKETNHSLTSNTKIQETKSPNKNISKNTSSIQNNPLKIGLHIKHERFGKGTIIGVEGTGDNTKIRVSFDDVGVKNLLVKYAKFTEID